MKANNRSKLKVPGSHKFGEGWILGKMGGLDAFSDGCVMCVGDPPPGKTCTLPPTSMDITLKNARPKRLIPAKIWRKNHSPLLGVSALTIFSDKKRTAIQSMYYFFLLERYPKIKFYLGKPTADAEKDGRFVLGVDKRKVVAVVMPFRWR